MNLFVATVLLYFLPCVHRLRLISFYLLEVLDKRDLPIRL